MELEILIRTSFGLCKDADGVYYAQIISDKEDQPKGKRNDIYFPIPIKQAKRLSKLLGVEISDYDHSISLYGYDIIG
jgi:hypothetical protein